MFVGVYPHKIDSKGRLSIPASFRLAGDGKYYITYSPDGCLCVYDEAGFKRREAELESLDEFDPQVRSLKRVFFSGPPPQDCDSHGRIKIPAQYIQHASLGKEVVLNGVSSYFEIWDKKQWDKFISQAVAGFDENMRALRRQHAR